MLNAKLRLFEPLSAAKIKIVEIFYNFVHFAMVCKLKRKELPII